MLPMFLRLFAHCTLRFAAAALGMTAATIEIRAAMIVITTRISTSVNPLSRDRPVRLWRLVMRPPPRMTGAVGQGPEAPPDPLPDPAARDFPPARRPS